MGLLLADGVQASPAQIAAGSRHVELSGHMEALRDPSGTLTIDDVRSPEWASRFQPVARDFNGGFNQTGSWWLRFSTDVSPAAAGEWWLELVAPFVDYLDIYQSGHDGQGLPTLTHRRSGNLLPVSSRDARTRNMAFRSVLQAGENTVWIRVQGVKTLNLKARYWTAAEFLGQTSLRVALLMLLMGMAGMMAVIGLLFGVWMRDRHFRWYSLYVVVSIGLFMATNGFLSLFLLPDSPHLASLVASLCVCLAVAVGTRMVMLLFDVESIMPRLARFLWLTIVAALLSTVVTLFGRYDLVVVLMNSLGLVNATLMVGVSLLLMLRRPDMSTIPYFVGFALYGVGVSIFIGNTLGLLPATPLLRPLYLVLAVAHLVAIAVGLGLRVRKIADERLRFQSEALAVAKRMGEALECKVEERTRELNAEVEECRQAERRLNDTLREQRNFLAMVSHEFRTPLSIISLSTQTLESLPPERERIGRETARISRANQRLLRLIETCLADEWLDSASMHLKCAPVDLAPWLEMLADEQSEGSGREIRVQLEGGPLLVLADMTLLTMVFDNLLGNAIKYSPEDTAIVVRAWHGDDGIMITVADQGPGIPVEEQARVFEKYYRSPTALKKAGVGLGLHVVKRIVELHGGDIRLDGTSAKGAIFVLMLPVCPWEDGPSNGERQQVQASLGF